MVEVSNWRVLLLYDVGQKLKSLDTRIPLSFRRACLCLQGRVIYVYMLSSFRTYTQDVDLESGISNHVITGVKSFVQTPGAQVSQTPDYDFGMPLE